MSDQNGKVIIFLIEILLLESTCMSMIGLDGGASCQVLLLGLGQVEGEAVPVMSEAIALCGVLEDGWPRSTRSKRNVPTAPLGNREEMIHFQHHFTQDDLITLCEWTVPAMRSRQVRRASALRGVSYEALHAPSSVCVLIMGYNRKIGTSADLFMVSFQMIFCSCAKDCVTKM